jgi:hypothetical protein
MSRIADEVNDVPPLKVYNTWKRWRLVKSLHVKGGEERLQYSLQRYSTGRNNEITWHMVAFFWSIEDFEEFIDFLNISADSIEDLDNDGILKR